MMCDVVIYNRGGDSGGIRFLAFFTKLLALSQSLLVLQVRL